MAGEAPLRVLGATAYPQTAASARVRVANYTGFLGAHGVDLRFRSALSEADYARLVAPGPSALKAATLARASLRAAFAQADDGLLLVHRLRLLNPFPGIDPPRRLDIYDLDDALFLGSAAAVNRRFQWAKQEPRRAAVCMRRSRLVIAGNRYLATEARRFATRVEVVPSCVDPEAQPPRVHREAEVVTIGWIGSHTTSVYLAPVLPVLARLNQHRLRARFVVVGGDTGLRADWLEHRPWSATREAADLASFDIGIMPLPDTDWARGKCGYKVLQYFAAGVPAVASPVGVSVEMLGEGRGLLATSPAEWEAALERLLADASERAQRGARAREFVRAHYSYQRWAPELASLLRSLAA